jgi:hypothetical protein
MSFEDDLRRVEEHVAEARRFVQSQKGLIVRLEAAGASTLDAQRFGSWNRTYGDWRNTETGSDQHLAVTERRRDGALTLRHLQ